MISGPGPGPLMRPAASSRPSNPRTCSDLAVAGARRCTSTGWVQEEDPHSRPVSHWKEPGGLDAKVWLESFFGLLPCLVYQF